MTLCAHSIFVMFTQTYFCANKVVTESAETVFVIIQDTHAEGKRKSAFFKNIAGGLSISAALCDKISALYISKNN